MVESEKLCNKYEKSINELLKWIQKKTKELGDFAFPNSLDGIRLLTLKFNKEYMTLEKPPKYTEKSEIEALFYSINMSLNSKGHPKYGAPEGKALHDLESDNDVHDGDCAAPLKTGLTAWWVLSAAL